MRRDSAWARWLRRCASRCRPPRRTPTSSASTGALTGPPASTNAPPVEALAHLHRPAQRRRRHQRQEDQPDPAGRLGRAVEGRRQRQEAAHAGQRQLLILMRACPRPTRRSSPRPSAPNVPLLFMGAVCPKEVYPPADPLQFCTTAYAARLRQPRHARLRQGDRQGAGEDRLRRHGDPALARRDRLRRGAGARRWA